MTRKLMSLADGKVVLALEGGYELNALAECGKLCIEALLNRQVNQFSGFLHQCIDFACLDSKISSRNSRYETKSIRHSNSQRSDSSSTYVIIIIIVLSPNHSFVF